MEEKRDSRKNKRIVKMEKRKKLVKAKINSTNKKRIHLTGCANLDKTINNINNDANDDICSMEVMIDDSLLRQQPSLALSQEMTENLHLESNELNEQQQNGGLRHSQSCPSLPLLSQHNLSLHDDNISHASFHSYQSHQSYQSHVSQMSHMSHLSLSNSNINSNSRHNYNQNQKEHISNESSSINTYHFGYIGTSNSSYNYDYNYNKIGSLESDIDWSLKQANHSNFSPFLLNDDNVNITDNDHFGNSNDTRDMRYIRDGAMDEKMNSAEDYHMYSKFRKYKESLNNSINSNNSLKLKSNSQSDLQDDTTVS